MTGEASRHGAETWDLGRGDSEPVAESVAALAVGEAETLTGELDHLGVVKEAVEQDAGGNVVTEHRPRRRPADRFAERRRSVPAHRCAHAWDPGKAAREVVGWRVTKQ